MGKQKRQIKGSWLSAFMDWTLPRSEAPASMIHWAGFFALASVLKRKVCFPRKLMGSYEIYPNLYVIYIGKPGVVRKSTTAGYAEEVLTEITDVLKGEEITFAPTAISDSKLIQALSNSPDGSLSVISSEFSSFVKTSPEGMYEILTDIYDGKKKLDYATRAHGVELAERPCINLLAATTPAWVSGQPPEYFIGGGFASRVIFVYESQRRQYKMYYDDVDYSKIDDLEKKLLHDLSIIASLKGEFKHDSKSTRDWIENWYQEHARKEVEDIRIQGYRERKPTHAHKLAMIISASERDDLIVTKEHFQKALQLLEDVEAKMPRALASIGDNPLGKQEFDLLDFIEARGKASKRELASRFHRDLSLDQLNELLTALCIMGKLEGKGNGMNPTYTLKGK